MFGLNSEIDFEPTRHEGLWAEEATCRILVFVSDGVSAFFRFSVALDAAAAEGLGDREIRDRLQEELANDLDARLPKALGMSVEERKAGGTYWRPAKAVVWRKDALRRLGYQSLAPHGLTRLGGERPPEGEELWRRTLR